MTSDEREITLDYAGNVNYWADRWTEGKIGWHKSQVNASLQKFVASLKDGTPKRFFVPLCGKTLDIPYLYEEGHHVFAVEAVPKPIEDLNTENGLGLELDPGNSTYSTKDGRIQIYCGDLFTCPFDKFGPFDCVWDRGAFIALEYSYRPAYVQAMQRSLQIGASAGAKYRSFKYLLETVDYDREKFGGPPRAVNSQDMETYFGSWTVIEITESKPETVGPFCRVADMTPVNQVSYLLTPKMFDHLVKTG